MIDWKRFPKPQEDGYDTWVINKFLNEKYGWTHSAPPSTHRLCNGRVAVLNDPRGRILGSVKTPGADNCADIITSEQVQTIDRHLAAWSEGYASIGNFLEVFYPKSYNLAGPGFRGSSSGHLALDQGAPKVNVDVTINDPEGCSAGIYHEVAHNRLEAIGMDINFHDGRLIENRADELYDSPVRYDQKRPMCAVIHGLYAWVMLTESDYWCGRNINAKDACEYYMSWHVPQIEWGLEEVRKYVRPTPEGMPFVDALLEWSDDLVTRSKALLVETLGEARTQERAAEAAAQAAANREAAAAKKAAKEAAKRAANN